VLELSFVVTFGFWFNSSSEPIILPNSNGIVSLCPSTVFEIWGYCTNSKRAVKTVIPVNSIFNFLDAITTRQPFSIKIKCAMVKQFVVFESPTIDKMSIIKTKIPFVVEAKTRG
jgi:hypothetical protein